MGAPAASVFRDSVPPTAVVVSVVRDSPPPTAIQVSVVRDSLAPTATQASVVRGSLAPTATQESASRDSLPPTAIQASMNRDFLHRPPEALVSVLRDLALPEHLQSQPWACWLPSVVAAKGPAPLGGCSLVSP